MQIHILLFATLKDLVGGNRLTLTVADGATVSDVRRTLISQYPHIEANVNAAIAAVNEEYAFPNDPVHNGDQVAFFPPVSGGGGDFPEIFKLAGEPINTDQLIAAITIPATG